MSRLDTDIRQLLCDSPGECLLRLGRLVDFLNRHGSHPGEVAGELKIGRHVCSLAVTFLRASDRLKLRALVEGWNLLKIRSSLRSEQLTIV
jgi:hypothetical protein